MKYLLIPAFLLWISACKSDGAKDDKNQTENYPTYDTNSRMEKINKGPEDRPANEPSNTDANHTTN